MRKRGQIAAQVFTYILGIIVVGLLLLVGIRAVDTLQDNQCDVRETQFTTQLASAIEKNKGFGGSHAQSFQLPCGADQVCFVSRELVDKVNPETNDPDALLTHVDSAFIRNSILSGDDTNVFLRVKGSYEPVERFQVAAPINLPLDNPVACIDGESVTIRFEGFGGTVGVHDERNG